MGIRFFCPGCQDRMNVKSFLAGKRGICPKCDARFAIPEESDPSAESGKSESGKSESGRSENAAEQSTAQGSSAEKIAVAQSQSTATKSRSENGRGESSDDRAKLQRKSAPKGESAGRNGKTKATKSKESAKKESAKSDSAKDSSIATLTIPTSSKDERSGGASSRTETSDARSTRATPPTITIHATSVDPSKVWYVRPRTGGEFGPADGPLMKRWIGEGRVAGDSLVWCEGWEDWKNAALVFPELDNNSPPVAPARPIVEERIVIEDRPVNGGRAEPAEAATRGKSDETKPQTNPRAIRRKPGRGKWTATVVLLTVVAIALVVILIKVLPTQM